MIVHFVVTEPADGKLAEKIISRHETYAAAKKSRDATPLSSCVRVIRELGWDGNIIKGSFYPKEEK